MAAEQIVTMTPDLAVAAVRDRIMATKAGKIQISPQYNLRASGIHPCDRNLYYQVTAWKERGAHTPETQCLFDFGNVVEDAALSDLRAAGYDVEHQQAAFEIQVKGGVITGHIDGWISGHEIGERGVPLEIKGYTWAGDRITHWREFLRQPQSWLQQVPCQLQLYLLANNAEWGVLCIFDKKSAQISPLPVELDYEFAESILRRAETVYAARDAGEPPERLAWSCGHCERCDWAHLCGPHAPVPMEGFVADPALVEAAQVYLETTAAAKLHDHAEKTLKDYAKALDGYEQFQVGPAQVSVKTSTRHYKEQPAKAAYDLECTTVKITPAEGPELEEGEIEE